MMRNKLLIILLPVIIFIFTYASAEDVNKEEPTQPKPVEEQTTPTSTIPVFAALTLNFGATYPTGQIAGDGGQSSLVSLAYGFSIEGGYKFTEQHSIVGSLGLSIDNLKTEAEFMGSTQTTTFTAQHLDIGVGYRSFLQVIPCYWEAGLVIGVPIGTWQQTSELNGSTTEADIDEADCKMKLGLFAGFGYTRPITKQQYLQVSLRMNVSFLPVYDDGDTQLRDNNMLILAGVGHKF
jgi:hypothetical protein